MAAPALPDREALKPGWNELRPGGATTCATGSDYRFFVRPRDSQYLLLHFDGGGACWSAETCLPDAENSTYISEIGPRYDPERRHGIFALNHPDNPVADYSMVLVPYCTGDVHLGDRDATYTLEDSTGGSRTYTIRHRGQANAQAVLDWVYANFDAPVQVLVSGSSAGGVATPFYADRVARHYPQARVIGLADAAGAYRRDDDNEDAGEVGADVERWGLPEVVKRHAGWEELPGLGVEDFYIVAATGTSNLELYQVDHAHDMVQRTFLELAGTEEPDVLQLLRSNRSDIRRATDAFRSFTLGGYLHTVLVSTRFYSYETDGHRFRDWVAAILTGDSVASVECSECDLLGIRYTEADLRLIDRALELLASEDRWNRQQREPACPGEATQWSLRCAVIQAARDVGAPPRAYAAFWDVLNTTYRRLGEGAGLPMLQYNNLESTGFDDVRSVLTEVRDRVRAALDEDR